MSTSGNREYASMATILSPVGKEPQKSMWTMCHGVGGNGDICSGSGFVMGPLAWQAKQPFCSVSTSWSILGNHIFYLSICFVLTRPWCPS